MRSSSILLGLAVLISGAAAQSPIADSETTYESLRDDTQDDSASISTTYDAGETTYTGQLSGDDYTDDQPSGDDRDSISLGAEEEDTPSPSESSGGDPTPAPGDAASTTASEAPFPTSDADTVTPALVPTPATSMEASASLSQTPNPTTEIMTSPTSLAPSAFATEGPSSEDNGVEAADEFDSARGCFASHYGGWRAASTLFLAGALGDGLRRGWLLARVF